MRSSEWRNVLWDQAEAAAEDGADEFEIVRLALAALKDSPPGNELAIERLERFLSEWDVSQ